MPEAITMEVPAEAPPIAQAFLDAGYTTVETDRIVNLLIEFLAETSSPRDVVRHPGSCSSDVQSATCVEGGVLDNGCSHSWRHV